MSLSEISRPIGLSLLIALLAIACTPEERTDAGAASSPGRDVVPADLVLTNGNVITVDPARPGAEAIAIRGSHILAVGSAADIAKHIGQTTELIDLQGQTAIPRVY